MKYVLLSFESTHYTIKADKILQQAGINGMVYPIPVEISKDCGMGLRIEKLELEKVLTLFRENNIHYKNIFQLEKNNLLEKFTRKNP